MLYKIIIGNYNLFLNRYLVSIYSVFHSYQVHGIFFRFPIIDSRFPIPDSRFPITDSRFPIPDSRFPIPDSRFPNSLLRLDSKPLEHPLVPIKKNLGHNHNLTLASLPFVEEFRWLYLLLLSQAGELEI